MKITSFEHSHDNEKVAAICNGNANHEVESIRRRANNGFDDLRAFFRISAYKRANGVQTFQNAPLISNRKNSCSLAVT